MLQFLLILSFFLLGSILVLTWSSFVRTMHLALGFAAVTIIWALGYIAFMKPGLVAGEALFGAMLAILFAAGFVAGRFGDDRVRPISVGLVAATVNLLVVGAFLRDERHGSRLTPILWVLGLYAVSCLLAWLGGALGRRLRTDPAGSLPLPLPLFAWTAAATVFLILITGGLVTGLESGLAVPDWPNSFGHNMLLYPVTEMKGGVYYEHAHRLYGMLVGTTALVLITVVWREDRRTWLRVLTWVLLAMICTQGVIGGRRVTGAFTLEQDPTLLSPSTGLAIVHGVFGQVVFAMFLVIAAVTGRAWSAAPARRAHPGSTGDRESALLLPALFLVQLTLGALYRHLHDAGSDQYTWAIYAHIGTAILLTVAVVIAGGRAWAHAAHPILRKLGHAILMGTLLQLLLGVLALIAVWSRQGEEIPIFEVVFTTVHQTWGALLFGIATLLALWSWRLLAPEASAHSLASTGLSASSSASTE